MKVLHGEHNKRLKETWFNHKFDHNEVMLTQYHHTHSICITSKWTFPNPSK